MDAVRVLGSESERSLKLEKALMRSARGRGYWAMKAWPPPNWASQAPGIALTSFSAFEGGMTMSAAPVATNMGRRTLQAVSDAIAMPRVHRGGLPLNEFRRQLRTRGRHNVAEFAINGFGDSPGK